MPSIAGTVMSATKDDRGRRKACRRTRKKMAIQPMVICVLALLSSVARGSYDDYYAAYDDAYAANKNYYDDQYKANNGGGGDDAYYTDDANSNDDAAAGDDAAADDQNAAGDDAAGDDAAVAGDDANSGGGGGDDAYAQEQRNYQLSDDDLFHWNANVGFGGVSVMPASCIN